MEAKIAGYAENKLPAVLKHKRNFKDPATMPKKTFLKDEEEILAEMDDGYGQEAEEQEEFTEGDFERHVSEDADFEQYPGQPDPNQIQKRLKVKFSHERGLKAGRFYDPNAQYLKMFEQKPPPAQGGAKAEASKEDSSSLPKISGTIGVSGQQFKDILRIIQVQNEGGMVLEMVNEDSEEVKQQME